MVVSRYVTESFNKASSNLVWKVHSIYNRTCNISIDNLVVASIHGNDVPLSPLSIQIPKFSNEDYSLNSLVTWDKANNVLTCDNLSIDFSGAETLDCKYIYDFEPRVSSESITTMINVYIEKSVECKKQLFEQSIKDRLHRLCVALFSYIQEDILIALDELIGLGIGLTPSGDDGIIGVVSSVRFRKKLVSAIDDIRHSILFKANASTTPVSAAYLRCVLDYEYIPSLSSVLHSIEHNDTIELRSACEKLCSIGSTSGIDCLLGIIEGTKYLHKMQSSF